jgi:SAM-dependent methyltransferase
MAMTDFAALMDEVQRRPTRGWDFTWLAGRMTSDELPWDFANIVDELAQASPNLLDLGTGGGEWLAHLPTRPPRTVATESWSPNVVVARHRLEPLGIEVLEVDGAPDNNDQFGEVNCSLPFDDGEFHLVSCRHESFVAREVSRILDHGGRFATQQVGDGLFRDVRALFEVAPPPLPALTGAMLREQVVAAGMQVVESGESVQTVRFHDVGALAWYLTMTPWTVPGFDVVTMRDALARLHRHIEEEGPLRIQQPSAYLVARRP